MVIGVSALIDRDTRAVMDILRGAMASSGLSQTAFARALATSSPRVSTYLAGSTRPSAHFLMRARRLGRALGAAASSGLMSAPVAATAMRRYYLAGDVDWIWRMLLQGRDHLRLALISGEQDLVDAWEAEPNTIGAREWDALLAAVVCHEFELAGVESPAWSRIDPLREPWMPVHPFLSPGRVHAQTPDWLRQLNIYVPERDLVTA